MGGRLWASKHQKCILLFGANCSSCFATISNPEKLQDTHQKWQIFALPMSRLFLWYLKSLLKRSGRPLSKVLQGGLWAGLAPLTPTRPLDGSVLFFFSFGSPFDRWMSEVQLSEAGGLLPPHRGVAEVQRAVGRRAPGRSPGQSEMGDRRWRIELGREFWAGSMDTNWGIRELGGGAGGGLVCFFSWPACLLR